MRTATAASTPTNNDRNSDGKNSPEAQSWWVDDIGNICQALETEGIRMFPSRGIDLRGNSRWDYRSVKTFPNPPEFDRVKRLRYDPAKDVMYLGGAKGEHVNQHWKPMGPVVCRFDGRSKGVVRPTWRIVAPYAKGSKGHESCEPIGFDVAGDYEFLPYTGASKSIGFKTGRIEVFRADDGRRIGFFEPSDDVGEIGLQDIRECLRAHRRADGEYPIFLEEDFKAKILAYRRRS